MSGSKENFMICGRCGHVVNGENYNSVQLFLCPGCDRLGFFSYVCEDCKGTEDLNGQPCHCAHD